MEIWGRIRFDVKRDSIASTASVLAAAGCLGTLQPWNDISRVVVWALLSAIGRILRRSDCSNPDEGAHWRIVVKGLPAYAKLAGESGLPFTGCDPCAKLRDTIRSQ